MARPTLVSLAAELGVSRQTVSNVLNAPHLVRPETRERVQAAIAASGYRPNVAAQALRSRRSSTIALRLYPTLDSGINGAVMDHFMHHMVAALRSRGYSLLVVTADSYDDEVAVLREMHERGRIDGCVLTDAHGGDPRPAALQEAGIETVIFGRPWGDEATSRHFWVDVDGSAGTRMATEHLVAQGVRRIGFIGWPEPSEVGADRRRGWQEAMTAAGLAAPDELAAWQAAGTDTMASGLAGMEALLDKGIEGVVCASDSLALGALEALRRRGSLGAQAPVVGFDDTSVARAMGLSSLHQPVSEAVELLATRLVDGLEAKQCDEGLSGSQLLEPRLVVRQLGEMIQAEHPGTLQA